MKIKIQKQSNKLKTEEICYKMKDKFDVFNKKKN